MGKVLVIHFLGEIEPAIVSIEEIYYFAFSFHSRVTMIELKDDDKDDDQWSKYVDEIKERGKL